MLSHVPADLALTFPTNFVWGVATSAFQIEGAAVEDGKGPSIWDTFCRQPGVIADASDGDIACDHYHRWSDDLDLIAGLGVNAYRFSVSWPRVRPEGEGAWNTKGLDFYERMVDGLLERGIKPYLTLNHWDLPAHLQSKGGWANRDTAHRFVEYALGVDARLGDRVKAITTHNEPWVISILGHKRGVFAPGLKNRAVAMQVSHHLLLSHGMALRAKLRWALFSICRRFTRPRIRPKIFPRLFWKTACCCVGTWTLCLKGITQAMCWNIWARMRHVFKAAISTS